MDFFIRVVNGQPFEHPIMGDNFREVFPDIDTDFLPEGFARFKRVDKPFVGPYQVYEGVTYEKDENGYTDVHHVRDMSAEEKIQKQNYIKQVWIDIGGDPNAVFNEDKCWFDPVITDVKVLP